MKIRLMGAGMAVAAMTLVGCATTSPGYSNTGPSGGYNNAPQASCYDCGVVTRIDQRSRGGTAPNATGAVLGGMGGAIAGNAIQNNVQGQSTYDVHVRLDNGRMTVVSQTDLSGVREGSYVRVANGRAFLR